MARGYRSLRPSKAAVYDSAAQVLERVASRPADEKQARIKQPQDARENHVAT